MTEQEQRYEEFLEQRELHDDTEGFSWPDPENQLQGVVL